MKQDRYFKFLVALVILGLVTALGQAAHHPAPRDHTPPATVAARANF